MVGLTCNPCMTKCNNLGS